MNEKFSLECKAKLIGTLNSKLKKQRTFWQVMHFKLLKTIKMQLLIVTDENDKLVGVYRLIEAGIK